MATASAASRASCPIRRAAERDDDDPVVVADLLVGVPVVELVGAHLEVDGDDGSVDRGDVVSTEELVAVDEAALEVRDNSGLTGLELCGEHDPRGGRLPAFDAPLDGWPWPLEPFSEPRIRGPAVGA
jgi:hypothetical protein